MEKIRLGKYKHFKGNTYQVTGVAKHSETKEELVIYRGIDGVTWVRPVKMFMEQKMVDGKLVDRFTHINTKAESSLIEEFEKDGYLHLNKFNHQHFTEYLDLIDYDFILNELRDYSLEEVIFSNYDIAEFILYDTNRFMGVVLDSPIDSVDDISEYWGDGGLYYKFVDIGLNRKSLLYRRVNLNKGKNE